MDITSGQILTWNLYLGGQLSTAGPVRVVELMEDGLLLWLSVGSPVWEVELPGDAHLRDIPPQNRPEGGYPVRPDAWHRGSALIYQPTGASHAVWWLFSADMQFQGWYVNFERRFRHSDSINVIDLELDLTVAPDRTWQWKDEESFEAKTGHPAYWTTDEAAAIRAEGKEVARLAEAGRFPFDGRWCDFRPSSDWGLPDRPAEPTATLLD
ncbi:DUF402 domain-containing protein [Streptomyces sp. NPDC127038]|uniref:DUF402 domain-containing protein n=1 Tax=Streptomyces sp. NPDC127038 TaxID=3347114 RepID=UPI0036473B09